jgi:hypothetical protein
MLEAEIIHLDLEKIMAVILSVVMQLNIYSGIRTEDEKKLGHEVIQNLKRLTLTMEENPEEAIKNLEHATLVCMKN